MNRDAARRRNRRAADEHGCSTDLHGSNRCLSGSHLRVSVAHPGVCYHASGSRFLESGRLTDRR